MVKSVYRPLALSTKIVVKIKAIVEDENSLYTNMTDFVKQAIREKIERMEQSKNQQRT